MKLTAEQSEKWMHRALELAEKAAERDEVPIGAVLVAGDVLLGEGSNRREETHRTTAHAEILALEEFNVREKSWRLPPGTSLFVTIEPCLMCTGALLWARAENIYYGCPDPRKAGITTQLPLIAAGTFDHRFAEVEGGILGEECARLMKRFFSSLRGPKARSNPVA